MSILYATLHYNENHIFLRIIKTGWGLHIEICSTYIYICMKKLCIWQNIILINLNTVSVFSIDIDGYSNMKTIILIQPKSNKPSGPISGKQELEYTFTVKPTNNPYWDEIYYYFDWGDGTFSDVIGPYSSNEFAETTHAWSDSRAYQIRVKALLTNSEESLSEETGWSDPLTIGIKIKSKFANILQFIFLHGIIQNLQLLSKIINLFLNTS